MTGIDRVEAAWADHLIASPEPAFALIRSAAGFLLLDKTGLAAWRAEGPLPARADLISRLGHRHDPLRARAETLARRLSVARCLPSGLARMLRRHLPPGAVWLNVGHANLSPRVFAAIARAGLRAHVLIHDTIPLDHPDLARPGTVEPFRARMAAVAAGADRVIHLTQAARALTEAQMARAGRVPPGVVAPLGLTPALPDATPCPPGPYFVALGTVEPRKNLGLLLDAWDRLARRGGPVPQLLVIGGQGWESPALFQRLATAEAAGHLRLMPGLPDASVAALLAGARALLFPSLAEGFGLPPLEAAALGTPVIASDIPTTRELLGDYPVYLSPRGSYSWSETIAELAGKPHGAARQVKRPDLPRWEDHFKTVLSLA